MAESAPAATIRISRRNHRDFSVQRLYHDGWYVRCSKHDNELR